MNLSKRIENIYWNKIEFQVNLPLVLFYLNYLMYGFYGSNTGGEAIFQFIITLFIIIFQICLGYISSLKYSFLYKKISFQLGEFLTFLPLFIIICFISQNYLLNSLEGDEFSFLQSSVIHSIEASHLIAAEYSIFSNIPFKHIIHLISAFLLLFNILLIFFSTRLNVLARTICIVFFLIAFRAVIYFIGGGNSSPHPSLILIPSFIFSSIFGMSSFFLKLGYQLVFGIFLFFLFKKINYRLDIIFATLIVLFIGTIPILNRLSTTLTPSLFTFIVFSYLLVEFSLQKVKNYYFIFFIIAVGTMFRLPTLIIIIPTIILYLNNNYSSFSFDRSLIIMVSPFLITLPFLSKTIFEGTPATNFNNSSFSLMEKIIYAFESNAIYVAALNSIEVWSLVLFSFAFVLVKKNINKVTNFIFFGICIIVYYSVKIDIWGLAKYQVELILPFTIIGLIYFCIRFHDRLTKPITYFLLTILITLNVISGYRYPKNIKNWDQFLNSEKNMVKINKEFSGLIRHVYNISPAYEYVKKMNLSGGLLSLNVDYGIMPEIINGFNTKEVTEIEKNSISYDSFLQNNSSQNPKEILNFLNKNRNIKVLILSNWNNEKSEVYKELINNKWFIIKEFPNDKHSSITYVLQRL